MVTPARPAMTDLTVRRCRLISIVTGCTCNLIDNSVSDSCMLKYQLEHRITKYRVLDLSNVDSDKTLLMAASDDGLQCLPKI